MDERVALPVVILLFFQPAQAARCKFRPQPRRHPPTRRSSQPCLIYTDQSTSQKLDFYLPPQGNGLAPVVTGSTVVAFVSGTSVRCPADTSAPTDTEGPVRPPMRYKFPMWRH